MTDTAITTTAAMSGELAAALVAALGELEDVGRSKTADAGNYRYRYADLADVLELVRPVLARHQLAVVQDVEVAVPAGGAATVSVAVLVIHSSGAVHRSPVLRLTSSPDPQRIGSAVSYARRYATMSALGIAAADEDDDGAAARTPPPQRRAEPSPRTEAERAIRAMLAAVDPDTRRRVQARFVEQHGARLGDLDPARHDSALAWTTAELEQVLGDAADRAAADFAHHAAEESS